MEKKLISPNASWEKPREMLMLSTTDALRLLNECAPHVKGHSVGAHPKLERLASLVGYDRKLVN